MGEIPVKVVIDTKVAGEDRSTMTRNCPRVFLGMTASLILVHSWWGGGEPALGDNVLWLLQTWRKP